MGQGEAKLTPAEVSLATQISHEMPAGIANAGKVKKVMAQFKANKKGDQEIRSVVELQQILEKLHYFKQQIAIWKEKAKPALVGQKACILRILDDALNKMADSAEFKESQATVLFKAFDKDGSGTINAKEFLAGFLIASSGNQVEDAKLRFDAYDIDGNGTLSKEEVGAMYKEGYISGLKMGKVLISAIFAGAFSQSAFQGKDEKKVVTFLIPRLLELVSKYLDKQTEQLMKHSTEIVEKIFALADADKNGVLSRDEYVTYSTNPEIAAAVTAYATSLEDPEVSKQMTEEIKEKTVDWILELSGASQEQIETTKPFLLAQIKEDEEKKAST